MAIRYYDDALCEKIKRWIGDSKLRVLPPSDTARLLQVKASLENDKPLKLPFVALTRDANIHLDVSTKRNMSYDGLKLDSKEEGTPQLNAIPISLSYQFDIYTSHYKEADEYLREFLFKLINNPTLKIILPYNGANVEQIAHIKVYPDIVDNSDVPSRLYSGEFTRWTLQLDLEDAYLFNIPISTNYKIDTEGDIKILEPVLDVELVGEDDEAHNGFTHIKEEIN